MNNLCSICLVEDTEHMRVITPCNHVFHTNCLLKWMKIKMTCPNCRKYLINRNQLTVQVSSETTFNIHLSSEKTKLDISKYVFNQETGKCDIIKNFNYPELEAYYIESITKNNEYIDKGSRGWKFVETLMPNYYAVICKQWVYISTNNENKNTFIIITETQNTPGKFIISSIFEDIWQHEIKIELF